MKPLHEEFIRPPRKAIVDLLFNKNGRRRRRITIADCLSDTGTQCVSYKPCASLNFLVIDLQVMKIRTGERPREKNGLGIGLDAPDTGYS